MSVNLYDLKDLDFQELSDQESIAVIGGDKFGCLIGAISGSVFGGPVLGVKACLLSSRVEDNIDAIF